MSIQSEIDRINQNVSDTYSTLSDLGADMPSTQSTDNLAETVAGVKAVLYGKAQSLTDDQKQQARENIGISADTVAFSDGETFQEKYDSGELKGATGATGAKGEKGDPGAGVFSMTYNSSTNKWTVLLTDGTSLTVDGPAIPDISGYMAKSGGAFTGAVTAAAADTGGYYVRNIKFSTEAEAPTVEGDICFKLG